MQRSQDGLGDHITTNLQAGDEVVFSYRMFTAKVVGEAGFPTSLVWEDVRKISWYVNRAGGQGG